MALGILVVVYTRDRVTARDRPSGAAITRTVREMINKTKKSNGAHTAPARAMYLARTASLCDA